MKLDNLSKYIDGAPYKRLYNKAKKCAAEHGIDFEREACFNSSPDVYHGFYFPNLEKYRIIAFIKGDPVLLTEEELDSFEG